MATIQPGDGVSQELLDSNISHSLEILDALLVDVRASSSSKEAAANQIRIVNKLRSDVRHIAARITVRDPRMGRHVETVVNFGIYMDQSWQQWEDKKGANPDTVKLFQECFDRIVLDRKRKELEKIASLLKTISPPDSTEEEIVVRDSGHEIDAGFDNTSDTETRDNANFSGMGEPSVSSEPADRSEQKRDEAELGEGEPEPDRAMADQHNIDHKLLAKELAAALNSPGIGRAENAPVKRDAFEWFIAGAASLGVALGLLVLSEIYSLQESVVRNTQAISDLNTSIDRHAKQLEKNTTSNNKLEKAIVRLTTQNQ